MAPSGEWLRCLKSRTLAPSVVPVLRDRCFECVYVHIVIVVSKCVCHLHNKELLYFLVECTYCSCLRPTGQSSHLLHHRSTEPWYIDWQCDTWTIPAHRSQQLKPIITRWRQNIKGQLQWKKSNRQNYTRRVVYLKTSYLRNLVYHCNICAQRKNC